jgi:hypothetical protein
MNANPVVIDVVPETVQPAQQAYKVDTSRGQHRGEVSAQWASRPADQKFLSLEALHTFKTKERDESRAYIADTRDIRVIASPNDPERLRIVAPANHDRRLTTDDAQVSPTHWSFGQACTLVHAPAGYLREQPAALAAINLQWSLQNHSRELVKVYKNTVTDELRAFTGPDYGRIHDADIAANLLRISRNYGWKVPGIMDWASGMYNPNAPVTLDSTTIYASDRDLFVFLVDDLRPIEVGKLPSGDPDLMFRGFYVWNSEVGKTSWGLAQFMLRAVCMNRNLWGVEGFREVRGKHSKFAPQRFASQAIPMLEDMRNRDPIAIVHKVQEAKAARVAVDDEQAETFLRKQGFSKSSAIEILATVLREEGHPARSVWDMVQGITAVARSESYQDSRVDVERVAGSLMERVK